MPWKPINLKTCYRLFLHSRSIIGIVLLSLIILYYLQGQKLEQNTYFISHPKEDIPIYLEVAKSESDISKGLSNRTYLPKQDGMIFVFPHPKILRFWMKDTKISLDLLYLDHNLVIREIHTNLMPYSEEVIQSQAKYNYAIELNSGFVAHHHIQIGDQVYRMDA